MLKPSTLLRCIKVWIALDHGNWRRGWRAPLVHCVTDVAGGDGHWNRQPKVADVSYGTINIK